MTYAIVHEKRLLASLIGVAIARQALGPPSPGRRAPTPRCAARRRPACQVTAKNVATGALRRTNSDRATAATRWSACRPARTTVDAGPGTEQTVTLSVASTATLDLAGAAPTPARPTTPTLERRHRHRNDADGSEDLRSRQHDLAAPDQHRAADHAQLPRIRRHRAGHGVSGRSRAATPRCTAARRTPAINVYIDGVGQKNYVKEGGVSGQFLSQGNPFPQLAIGEYKVITSNYKAEYDQISSAAVTAETKSGTNEFHGEVFGTYTDDAGARRRRREHAAGKKTQSQEKEYGLAFGGPIIQDQMHFFFTYEAKRFDTPMTVVPA